MSFLVTARKWRPQKFSEVVGQDHISITLKNAIKNGRIAHAYLFAGPRGVGKTTTARIMAKILNCSNPQDGEPCNECDMCKSFNSQQSLDVIEIDGASNRRIEEIRQLRESVKYAPTKGKFKVYIIDEVHMLTTESFNALLKTLEEPPEHTIFIFATTDVHKVPATIISRCQRYDFRRIELNTIKELLSDIAKAENISIDDQSLTIIAKKADGALRDSQSIFDQVISFCGNKVEGSTLISMMNLINEDVYFDLSDSIINKDYKAAFNLTEMIYRNGWNFIDFINGLTEHFRNVFTAVIRKDTELIESAEVYKDKYLKYKDAFSEGDVLRILQHINKLSYEIKSAQNQRIKLEISLAQIIALERTETLSKLISVLNDKKKLEELKNISVGSSGVTQEKKSEVTPKAAPQSNKFIAPPVTSAAQVNNTVKEEPKEEQKVQESKPQYAHLTLKEFKRDWKKFWAQANGITLKLGVISNARPVKYTPGKLTLKLERLTDERIFKQNPSYMSLLQTEIENFFGANVKVFFQVPKTLQSDELEYLDNSEKDTPIIQAIKNELGGREYKSYN